MKQKKFTECSKAIAEAVAQSKPEVIFGYPVTPQTHIIEHLSKLVAEGKLNSQYYNSESEHSALSALIGASACNSRTYTATSSQGLALMSEMLPIASGLRLPIVMTIATRALSAPINIWNDHSDSMMYRDSGWIQFHCENVQEAYDSLFQAYKIAESCLIPVMHCIDGFNLSHLWESFYPIEQEKIEKFLGKINLPFTLNPKKPITLGSVASPEYYMYFKKQQEKAFKIAEKKIKQINLEFKKIAERKYGNGLIEIVNPHADIILVAMGSICSTIRQVISKNKNIGLLKIRSFRPFPYSDIKRILEKKKIKVIERAISLGAGYPLTSEIKSLNLKCQSFILGLGGRNISEKMIERVINSNKSVEWIY